MFDDAAPARRSYSKYFIVQRKSRIVGYESPYFVDFSHPRSSLGPTKFCYGRWPTTLSCTPSNEITVPLITSINICSLLGKVADLLDRPDLYISCNTLVACTEGFWLSADMDDYVVSNDGFDCIQQNRTQYKPSIDENMTACFKC